MTQVKVCCHFYFEHIATVTVDEEKEEEDLLFKCTHWLAFHAKSKIFAVVTVFVLK